MLDNIVQGFTYFVQFCLTFNTHNYVAVTSCSSFIRNINCFVDLPFDPQFCFLG